MMARKSPAASRADRASDVTCVLAVATENINPRRAVQRSGLSLDEEGSQ